MSWLLRHNWPWTLLAFLLGAVVTWLLLSRRTPVETPAEAEEEVKEEALVGAAASPAPAAAAPAPAARKPARDEPVRDDQVRGEPVRVEPAPVASPRTEPTKQAKAEPTPEAVQAKAEPEPARAEPAVATPVRDAEAAPPLVAEPEVVAASPHVAEPAMAEPMTTAVDSEFSRVMGEPTLFDDEVPVGRFGPGSADAVPHQGPPDGFTIKGNAQSMLFHTPDSPYYGRTKAEVWFRTEGDAERAGFTKYVRKPRKSTQPGQ